MLFNSNDKLVSARCFPICSMLQRHDNSVEAFCFSHYKQVLRQYVKFRHNIMYLMSFSKLIPKAIMKTNLKDLGLNFIN